LAAGINPATKKPQATHITAIGTTPGRNRVGTMVSGARTANGWISRRRRPGRTSRPMISPPRMKPAGSAIMMTPWIQPRSD
jgi:hypothetical protein